MERIAILSIIVGLVVMVTSDTNVETTNGIENLQTKWKNWVPSFDANHDKIFCLKDAEKFYDEFKRQYKLSDDQTSTVKANIKKYWIKCVLKNENSEETEAEIISRLTTLYSADKDGFVKYMTNCFNDILNVIDKNNDMFVSLEEYIHAYKAFGHYNEVKIKEQFVSFNPLLPLKGIVSSWVRFVSCESRECFENDIIEKEFEEGL